jgi:sugar lactone lactonase YvrE
MRLSAFFYLCIEILVVIHSMGKTPLNSVERKFPANNNREPYVLNSEISLWPNSFIQRHSAPVPATIFHSSLLLDAVSPNLYMQLVAGANEGVSGSGDNGPATLAPIGPWIPWVDSSGNVYIPEGPYRRIRKVTPAGIITTFGETGIFNSPYSIVGNAAGNVLYISDGLYVWKYLFATTSAAVYAHTGGQVTGFSGDNGPATSAQLSGPMGLWLTTGDVLYIADNSNHRIRKIISPSGIITTVAGSGCSNGCTSAFSGENVPATSATLRLPRGVYVDTTGKLFIADTLNKRIRVVDTNNIITTFAGTGSGTSYNGDYIPAISAITRNPYDIKGDSAGNIYFADNANCLVRVIDTAGIISTLFGTPNSCGSGFFSTVTVSRFAAITQPIGLWIDSASTVYFSDSKAVRRGSTVDFPPNRANPFPNMFLQSIPETASATIPWVDNSGVIYLPQNSPSRILKVDLSGIVSTFGGTGTSSSGPIESVRFSSPCSIVGDRAGSVLYISDEENVWKYLFSTGNATVISNRNIGAGFSGDNGPVSSAALNGPSGLWLTTAGILYIVDNGNHRIRKVVTSSGIITTVTGSSCVNCGGSFSGDNGPATSALLNMPLGVYVDTMGKLFIADAENHRIRLVDVNGIITTFAGTGSTSFNGDRIPRLSTNLKSPSDVKGDSVGNIYIAEKDNCILRIVDNSGIVSALFGTPGVCSSTTGVFSPFAPIQGSSGIWIDSAANIYFSDRNLLTVYRSFVLSSPTSQPSDQPTSLPSGQPTMKPTQPTSFPSRRPTSAPSTQPTTSPSKQVAPTAQPTRLPSGQPFSIPSSQPSSDPSVCPSVCPTSMPSPRPSVLPTVIPTQVPRSVPSAAPSAFPTSFPSSQPSKLPSAVPTKQPTSCPSCHPTGVPSTEPSGNPSAAPTGRHTGTPSTQPTSRPSEIPSCHPTNQPSGTPSKQPTGYPSSKPTRQPSGSPSVSPSSNPSVQSTTNPTAVPSNQPSSLPTSDPSIAPSSQPSEKTSSQPSKRPSVSPTRLPTANPSCQPTGRPSGQPTSIPSYVSSTRPTVQPSSLPSGAPTNQPTARPFSRPSSNPTGRPSVAPSINPTVIPSRNPSSGPSAQPSRVPSDQPTSQPSSSPTERPSRQPSSCPSSQPTTRPTKRPSSQPSRSPSAQPSKQPVSRPSSQPSRQPSSQPSLQPTSSPSSSRPSASPTLASSAPTPVAVPSISSSPSTTKKPTRSPTMKPTRRPTVTPTVFPTAVPTLAPTNALSVVPVGSNHFRGSLFLLGITGSSTELDTSNILLDKVLSRQKSFVFFGQRKNNDFSNILIGSRESHGYYSEVVVPLSGMGGLNRDDSSYSSSRSVTIMGDINNDGFDDLLLGFPTASTCLGYLGSEKGFQNLIVSFSIYGATPGDEFGWSVAKAGDVNRDQLNDMIICAKAAGVCYVLYGRSAFNDQIYVQNMSSSDGFRIIGSASSTINFGMAVDYAGDFNKDGFSDLVISAMSFASQGIIYVIFGRPVDLLKGDITIETSNHLVYSIITPLFAFAGLSITGIGDMNNDGFDDIAIGSVPFRGGYQTQRTYVVFGRTTATTNRTRSLDVSEMIVGKDGFTITGGGFLVSAVGDLNQDGIADLMITSYYDWRGGVGGKSNGYLMNYPRNMSSSPTYFPSSSPSSFPSFSPSSLPTEAATTKTPSNHPSVITAPPVLAINESSSPTVVSSPKPTKRTNSPTIKLSHSPSFAPTTAVTISSTMKPTVLPTKVPSAAPFNNSIAPTRTVQPTVRLRSIANPITPATTVAPSNNQTAFSLNGLAFTVAELSEPGEYIGSADTNEVFSLTSPGYYHITTHDPTSNSPLQVTKMLSLKAISNQIVTIIGFQTSSDIIDLQNFPTIHSMEDISYTTNPLEILLPAAMDTELGSTSSSSVSSHVGSSSTDDQVKQKQSVTLMSFDSLNSLAERNFLFRPRNGLLPPMKTSDYSFQLLLSLGIIILMTTLVTFCKCITEDLNEEMKEEEKQKREAEMYEQMEANESAEYPLKIEDVIDNAPTVPVIEDDEEAQRKQPSMDEDDEFTLSSLFSEKSNDSIHMNGTGTIENTPDAKDKVTLEELEDDIHSHDIDDLFTQGKKDNDQCCDDESSNDRSIDELFSWRDSDDT